jgi:hypothetical protein
MAYSKDTWHMLERLKAAGISEQDALALRRINMTLQRWHELECGDGNDYASWSIERNEKTDVPYLVTYLHTGETRRSKIPDREKGAKKRLAAIMARYPTLSAYIQGDPRRAALFILRPGDVPKGADVNAYYSNGIAVYR